MQSTLGYILLPESCVDIVTNCTVVDSVECSIASDHLPIIASLNIPTSRFIVPNKISSPSWHKASEDQFNDYQYKIESYLNTLNIEPLTDSEAVKNFYLLF